MSWEYFRHKFFSFQNPEDSLLLKTFLIDICFSFPVVFVKWGILKLENRLEWDMTIWRIHITLHQIQYQFQFHTKTQKYKWGHFWAINYRMKFTCSESKTRNGQNQSTSILYIIVQNRNFCVVRVRKHKWPFFSVLLLLPCTQYVIDVNFNQPFCLSFCIYRT